MGTFVFVDALRVPMMVAISESKAIKLIGQFCTNPQDKLQRLKDSPDTEIRLSRTQSVTYKETE